MSTLFFYLIAAAVLGSAALMLFRRHRGHLAADARAREMLETRNERASEATQVEAWGKTDTRDGASR